MRERFGGSDVRHRGNAFERVKAAKKLAHNRFFDRPTGNQRIFERQQIAPDASQMLVRFGVIIVEKLLKKLLVEFTFGHKVMEIFF